MNKGISIVLLALGIFVAAGFSRRRWTIESLAVLAALLAFTKINGVRSRAGSGQFQLPGSSLPGSGEPA